MAKLPAFMFFPGDWRRDPGVQSLGFHDRGVWFEILCLMHESEDRGKLLLNGNSMPDDALARLLGLDKQVLTNTITVLLSYGVASRDPNTGALVSRRMVRDEKVRKIRAECGKLGGNPALVKQTTTTFKPPNKPMQEPNSFKKDKPLNESENEFEIIPFLMAKVGLLYKRPESQRWSHLEESLLVEISKRENAKNEFEQIEKYRSSLKTEDVQFFPRSVSSLLSKWNDILDASRLNINESKRSSWAPTAMEVQEYSKTKGTDMSHAISFAVAFYRHWNDPKRNWMEGGRAIDWKIKFSEQIAKQRK